MCLRTKFCNHQWPGRTKLLKSLYPNIHTVIQAGFEVKILRQLDGDISGTLVKVFLSLFLKKTCRCRWMRSFFASTSNFHLHNIS
jgi:hypothetical protein